MDIGNWFYWTLNIGGEKSGDSSDGTSRSYKGLLWTLLNSNNFKIPNYEIYIALAYLKLKKSISPSHSCSSARWRR